MPDTRYVLADNGVTLQGSLVDAGGRVHALPPRRRSWKLLDAVQHVYSDGWAGRESAYTYFDRASAGRSS